MSNEDSSRSAPGSPGGIDERRMRAWIGTALTVEGKVISTQDLTIDGAVKGAIELGNHGLTIGSAAKVKANLVAQAITISGTVMGNVTATSLVDLRATGSVEGDITTPCLVVADGAIINGKVDATGKRT